MTQLFPTSAQVIYETLSDDSTFMSYLGTYNFKAGQSAPAISVVSAGQDLPSLRKVEGVECIIQDAAGFQSYPYVSNDPARVIIDFPVFLIAWEPSTGADMQTAALRCAANFLNSYAVQTVATQDGLGALVQTKVIIRSDMPIINPF